MVLKPLRTAPMMLGGVGFQAGWDEAQRRIAAERQAAQPAPPQADVVQQLKDLKALQDTGVLSPEEFEVAKRKVLAG